MICYGEILWDCLPSGKVLGGAQLNMSVQMHNLGMKPLLISAVGQDKLGDELLSGIKKLGLDTSGIGQIKKYPTSTVDIVLDDNGKPTYDIKMPVAWDAIPIKKEHLNYVAKHGIVFGSMAQRMKEDSYNNLDKLLEKSKLNFFDANFRLPFTTDVLMKKYLPSAHIFKLNDEELPILLSWLKIEMNEEDGIKALSKKFNIDEFILTKGSDGSKLYISGNFVEHPGYEIDVADTVGCGDAFTAGYLYARENDLNPEKRLEWASAVSAVVASKKGGCCNVKIKEVKSIIESQAPPTDLL
jgi:fructokinase